jgi:hypothetical protein
MPRFQIGSIDLSEDEIDWLKVSASLSSTSVRAQVGQAIQGHLVRFKPHYKRKVAYVARKYGLTWEEAFKKLTLESPPFENLPVVEEAPIREDEEMSNFGCEVNKGGNNANTNTESTAD